MDMLEKLSMAGIVPVIKVEDAGDAVPLCRALADGGLPVAEITFRSDAAEESIRRVHQELPDVLLGAGTVLTRDQVDRAIGAGAAYIVSPGLNPQVVEYCLKQNVAVLPGCANPSDIEVALSLGLDTVKFFPAEALGGLPLIKAMSAPYGQVRFVPTGGINERNLNAYLAFSKVVACGGSWMVPQDAVYAKDWQRIERLTRSAVTLMLGFSLDHVGVGVGSRASAVEGAEALCRLLGWEKSETAGRQVVGHAIALQADAAGYIAIACNNLKRVAWHLSRRGFSLGEAAEGPDGRKMATLVEKLAEFTVCFIEK